MGHYKSNGKINTTSVPGTSSVSVTAADGGINVILDDASGRGVYHKSGAIRVNSGSSTSYYDSTGATYSNHLMGPGT